MSPPVQLTLNPLVAKKIKEKADKEKMPPENLVNLYLLYCLVHHNQIINFEKKIVKNSLTKVEK